MVEAVLLDVYGTLLDTDIYRSSLRHIVRDLGLSADQKEEAKHLVLTSNLRSVADMARAVELKFGLGPTSNEALRKTVEEIEEHKASFQLYDGVPEAISDLRAEGYKLALVSNVSTQYLDPIHRLKVDTLADVRVYSCEVGFKKPDPEIFHIALRALRVSPAGAVMVGDNPGDDISGAVAAGIKSVLIEREESDPRADAVVSSFGEVPNAILKLNC